MLVNEDDKNFWLDTVKNVKEYNSENIIIKKNNSIKIINNDEFITYIPQKEFNTYSKYIDDISGGIDSSTIRKFKQENFKTETVLDLHGCTEDEAFTKVDCFIQQCYNIGKRCVIIITGKGKTIRENDDIFTNKGILKRMVPQWLDMPRLRAMILVYKHTSEKLGGSGALYILLKKNKNIK